MAKYIFNYLLCCILVFIGGCATTQSDLTRFYEVKDINTIEAYEDFLAKFPNSSYADEAKERIENIKEEAKAAVEFKRIPCNIKDLEDYVKKYPTGRVSDKARKKIEDLIIEEIMKNGIANRFTILELKPEKEGYVGSCTIMDMSMSKHSGIKSSIISSFYQTSVKGHCVMCMEYPEDKIIIGSNFAALWPLGNGSVLRFKGKIPFKEFIFEGQENDPLVFIFCEEAGFVYVKGSGLVTLKDGKIISLPN
jgi:hypothetical protein